MNVEKKSLFDTVFSLIQRQINFNHSKLIKKIAIVENQYKGGFGNKWMSWNMVVLFPKLPIS